MYTDRCCFGQDHEAEEEGAVSVGDNGGSEDVQDFQGRDTTDQVEDLELPAEIVFGERQQRYERVGLQTLIF